MCRLPEKGRKEIVGDEREGQGRKRNRNEREETEEIKTFPLNPYPLIVHFSLLLSNNEKAVSVVTIKQNSRLEDYPEN